MKNFINRAFIILYIVILMACDGKQQNQSSPETKNIKLGCLDSLITSRYKQDLFHGAIVISEKGKVIFEKYLGLANRDWGITVEKDVKFDIASVNKSMTAALIMKAVEAEQLQLTDKLTKLLKGYKYEGEFHPDITVHHLLSHSSGLADYDGVAPALRENDFLKFKRLRFTNTEYINFISKLDPVGAPDEKFYYSNFAYHLLAIILEDIYEKPFKAILEENLSKPLGLSNTVAASHNEEIIENLAIGYNYDKNKNAWKANPFIDLSLGRRIFSTASDLNRWALSMSNPGYLSKGSLELIKTNHLIGISNEVGYGYGWVVSTKAHKSKMGDLGIDQPYIIHGGSTDGNKAMLININEGKYVISFLSNVGDRTDEMYLAQQIVNILTR